MRPPTTRAPVAAEASPLRRFLVARCEHVRQGTEALAQRRDAVRGEVARARLDVLRQVPGVIVHFLEQAADLGPRVFGMIGGIPLERA